MNYKLSENNGNSKILTFLCSSGIEGIMKNTDEHILRATKEIIVKFIEMGRLSPANVHECFRDVYATVNDTVKTHTQADPPPHETKP
jgi:hypothetical protein